MTAYLDLPVLALCLKTGMIMSGLGSQKRCGAGQRGRTDKDSYVKRLMTSIETLPCSTESSSHKEEAALLSLWGLAAVSCRSQANKSVKRKGGWLVQAGRANEKNKFKHIIYQGFTKVNAGLNNYTNKNVWRWMPAAHLFWRLAAVMYQSEYSWVADFKSTRCSSFIKNKSTYVCM